MEKKKISPVALVLCLAYAAQLILVAIWQYSPVERRDFAGVRYEIVKGHGFPMSLIPIYGLLPLAQSKYLLIKVSVESDKKEQKSFSSVKAIYQEHADVWPDKL